MKRYEKPEISLTFVKNTDIINVSNAVTQLGNKFNGKGIKYKTVIF